MSHSKYLSYLLRMWQVHQGGEDSWQASLDDPRTGERHGFANLESLTSFLQEKMHAKDIKQVTNSNGNIAKTPAESEE